MLNLLSSGDTACTLTRHRAGTTTHFDPRRCILIAGTRLCYQVQANGPLTYTELKLIIVTQDVNAANHIIRTIMHNEPSLAPWFNT
jgi:hypothetical protein